MKALRYTVVLLLAAIFSGGFASQNPGQVENEPVPNEYILTGTVMDDESAINALKREAMLIYQLNLPKYLDEIPKPSSCAQIDFDDKDFAVVGSLATVDASIVFGEGIKNLRVLAVDNAAGFPGRPNPMNDQLHNRVQRLNAFRNILWLLKEKLRSGVVTADASLMDKLREAQTWLSTQTGGHLGQAVTTAFERSGLMAKLETKWGATSVKFGAFSAVAANGLDFVINGFNTAVNSIALNQEVTDANILAVSSSVSAMAGDVTMAVTQILTTSAKVAPAAGPVGYAVAATLYIASYATGVASGLVSQDDLEPKDYVKAFLSPLIPSPGFGAMVDMIDAAASGNPVEAWSIYMTRSVPASLVIGGMALIDRLSGTTYTTDYLRQLRAIRRLRLWLDYIEESDAFQLEMKESVRDLVRKLKPKKFFYAYPAFDTPNAYIAEGWENSATLKSDFEITSSLTNKIVFLATYNSEFPKPQVAYPSNVTWDGKTFVPQVVDHGDDPFLFIGSDDMDDKVLLDANSEAYGMGGDDTFSVNPTWGSNTPGIVKIDGGAGSDTIYTSYHAHEGVDFFVTGGGPERDSIRGGKGNDFIYVENDTVSDTGGENTILVRGSGDDTIEAGPGTNVIIVNKTSGSILVDLGRNHDNEPWKSRRIVYEGDALTTQGTVNQGTVRLSGGNTQHDVLSMTKYHPVSLPSSPRQRMIAVMYDFAPGSDPKYTTLKFHFDKVDDIADHLFENTRCTRRTDTDPPVFCPEAEQSQRIFYQRIERFELSKDTVNLMFVLATTPPQMTVTHEIIGGPFDDYIINAVFNIPLMAQMGTGANRLISGNASDSYSLILDEHKDIIYDKGGHNLVAVMLPERVTFSNVYIGQNSEGDSFLIYRGEQETTKEVQLQFKFHDPNISGQGYHHKVQFFFKESTGKEIVFKMLQRPSNWPWDQAYYDNDTPNLEEIYSAKVSGPDYSFVNQEVVESVTPP